MQSERLEIQTLMLARQYVYELFYHLLGGNPSLDLACVLVSDETREVLESYRDEVPATAEFLAVIDSLKAQLEEDGKLALGDLMSEYTRLLIGPLALAAQPFESVYRSKEPTFFQSSTLVVRQDYKAQGLVPVRLNHVPDDHVAMECAFMAIMAGRVADAFEQGNYARTRELLVAQGGFAMDHMGTWLSEFSATVSEKSTTKLIYPEAIAFLAEFIQTDCVFASQVLLWMDEQEEAGSDEVIVEDEALPPLDAWICRLKAVEGLGLSDYALGEASPE